MACFLLASYLPVDLFLVQHLAHSNIIVITFMSTCLSIALSLGGAQLWYQLGWPLFQVNSIHMMNDVLELKGFYDISANQKKVVWFDVATCIAGIIMTTTPCPLTLNSLPCD